MRPPGTPRIHGGPDALGVPRFDLSTTSNACGPCPQAMAAVQQADATRYPDPHYAALRAQLASFHGVVPGRILLAGSASECIFRLTAWAARGGGTQVCVPQYAYGDYGQAAQAWGLGVRNIASDACLVWCCEPSSPLGGPHSGWPIGILDAGSQSVPIVLDCAYAPLRLSGVPSLSACQSARLWQMYSPNKALGLTGVRAAYAIAPVGGELAVQALDSLAHSWPLGAQGVALLHAWVQPEVQGWIGESLHTLRRWKNTQIDMLSNAGWNCLPSDANFFCAQPASVDEGVQDLVLTLARLRACGVKLRDATSFGLPGHVRLSVQPPQAQDALRQALQGGRC